MYKELFEKYNGRSIDDDSKNGYIFYMFKYTCECIALMHFKGLTDLSNEIKEIFGISDCITLNCSSGVNNIGGYKFKPIFNSKNIGVAFNYVGENLNYNVGEDGEYVYKFVDSHSATLEYLNSRGIKHPNIYAITSLVRNENNKYCFRSYIYNKNIDFIYDFSNNIMMNKKQYDELCVVEEINCLNYFECDEMLKNNNCDKEGFNNLLFLSLVKLKEKDNCKKLIKIN